MRWVRVWLPVGIIAAGLVIIVATGGSIEGWEGGAAVIGAGLSVWLLNLFFRVGVQGERERDAEDEARAFYAEHGHWPDEQPPPSPSPQRPADPRDPHSSSRPSHPHPSGRGTGSTRRPPRRP